MNRSVFTSLSPKAVAAYFDALPPQQQPSYFGATLFPDSYTPELTLSFLRGKTPTPIALNLSSFDSQPPIRERFGYEKTHLELPFFREALLIKEEEYSALQRVARGDQSEPYVRSIIDNFYNDIETLITAGLLQKESMRMQLLGNAGIISLTGAGSRADYDYRFPNENKFAPAVAWNNTTTADPIADLYQWRKTMWGQTGFWPTLCVLSPKTWKYIMDNEKIRNGILHRMGTAAGSVTTVNVNIPGSAYGDYIRSAMDDGTAGSADLRFYVYDKVFKARSNAPLTSIYPDDVISLLPSGPLGSTWWSDTPESLRDSDARPGQNFSVATVNAGITICQVDNIEPPVTLKTWGSLISLPSFERINDCGWARVA